MQRTFFVATHQCCLWTVQIITITFYRFYAFLFVAQSVLIIVAIWMIVNARSKKIIFLIICKLSLSKFRIFSMFLNLFHFNPQKNLNQQYKIKKTFCFEFNNIAIAFSLSLYFLYLFPPLSSTQHLNKNIYLLHHNLQRSITSSIPIRVEIAITSPNNISLI